MIIETERLILRECCAADSSALMNVFGDEEVMRYSEAIRDEAWVQTWVRNTQESYRTLGYGNWAVVTKQSDLFIGYCGLTYADSLAGSPEVALGYRLVRRSWGFGYATEAVRATLHYGLSTLRLGSIVATIDPHNLASIRLAEKVGMAYEKDMMREWYTHPDRVYRIRKLENPELSSR